MKSTGSWASKCDSMYPNNKSPLSNSNKSLRGYSREVLHYQLGKMTHYSLAGFSFGFLTYGDKLHHYRNDDSINAERFCYMWWLMPIMPAPRRQQKGCCTFEASLGYFHSDYRPRWTADPNQTRG